MSVRSSTYIVNTLLHFVQCYVYLTKINPHKGKCAESFKFLALRKVAKIPLKKKKKKNHLERKKKIKERKKKKRKTSLNFVCDIIGHTSKYFRISV